MIAEKYLNLLTIKPQLYQGTTLHSTKLTSMSIEKWTKIKTERRLNLMDKQYQIEGYSN